MCIISLLLCVLLVFSIVYGMIGANDKTGLTIDNTKAMKGLLAISILLSHMTGLTSTHLPFFSFSAMGSIGVGAFFFMSGYGLVKASRTKGYFDNFLYKHALKILVPYLMLLIVWICLICGVLGNSFHDFLNSFKKGAPISNSWYVFACLYTYILFWLSYRKYKKSSILTVLVGVTMWSAFFSLCINWPDWWYKTICCFPIGIVWGTHTKPIEKYIKEHYSLLLFASIILLITSYMSPKFLRAFIRGSNLWLINDVFMGISGAIFCGVVLQRLSLVNPITAFLGKISYCFYLFHGLVLKSYELLIEKGIGHKTIELTPLRQEMFSCVILLATIVIAYCMHLLSNILISSAGKRLLKRYRNMD